MMNFDSFNDYENKFMQEIELCISLNGKGYTTLLSDFLNNIELEFNINKYPNLIKESYGDGAALRLTLKDIADSDNNILFEEIVKILLEKKDSFNSLLDKIQSFDFSVYIWSQSATDTPQFNLNYQLLKIFGEMKIKFSLIIYTYDPN